jgi:tetratricopeptide (TPR) repeat protein
LLLGLCLFIFFDGRTQTYDIQRKFDYFFLESIRLKEKGEHTNAFNTIHYLLKIDSTSSSALYELSHYYQFLEKNNLAFDALSKAVNYSPDNFEYRMSLADLSREMGKNDKAINIYEQLVKENPDKPELNYYLSGLYLRVGEIDKAIESLNDLENNMGINEAVSMQKFNLYNQLKANDKALVELEKLSGKFPMEARYLIFIGDFYLSQEKPDEALRFYDKAHKVDPLNPYYYLSLAGYYEHLGMEDAATQEIDNALRNPSLDIETKLNILGKYIQNLIQTKKDVEKVNSLLLTLLEQHPQEKELNAIYGEFLISQNKLEEAKFQFQIVTEAEPDNITAWRQLLSLALRENKMDKVIAICRDALIHFPDASEFYFYMGTAYHQNHEYDSALETFLKGLQSAPADNRMLLSNFHGQIGDLYYQMDDKEKAYQNYEIAIDNDENNLLILNNYAYFLSLDKVDLDKAERMSAKCVQLQPNNSTYLDTYAWIFFQKTNYSLAKFYIESALSKEGGQNNGDITEHYGDILFKTGNIDKALNEWGKALVLKEKEGENTNILIKKITNKSYYEK